MKEEEDLHVKKNLGYVQTLSNLKNKIIARDKEKEQQKKNNKEMKSMFPEKTLERLRMANRENREETEKAI